VRTCASVRPPDDAVPRRNRFPARLDRFPAPAPLVHPSHAFFLPIEFLL
jgi:hypothetical protein